MQSVEEENFLEPAAKKNKANLVGVILVGNSDSTRIKLAVDWSKFKIILRQSQPLCVDEDLQGHN